MDSTDGLSRGLEVRDTGEFIQAPVGDKTLGRVLNVVGQPIDGKGPSSAASPAHPPQSPTFDRQEHPGRSPGDRHQGGRPPGPLRQGRQDRPVRRRRRGQDRADSGAHQQHRQVPRRLLRVRRRGRAHPRGHRALRRNGRSRRHRQDRPRVRPDERAPGSPRPRGPHRAHHRRVLPRREAPGRAAVHRQHLPLHPGGLRSVGAAGTHSVRRGLPADPRHRHGRAAGAHHLHQERFGHLHPGHLRARRRLHRPRSRHRLHPPGRHHEPRRQIAELGIYPAVEPAGLLVRACCPRTWWARSTTTWPAACSVSSSATRNSRTSSRSWAWTNSPKKTA
jgi:hypothetical protein